MPKYRIDTWFERDRAMVALYDGDQEIATWWDDDVLGLVEDGFLDPRNWLKSAVEYTRHLGIVQ